MGTDLDRIYRAYIGALNDRRLDDLDRFGHPRLTYNGQPWTREQYRARLADDVRAVPDLRYDIELLVVDGTRSPAGSGSTARRKGSSSASTPAGEN